MVHIEHEVEINGRFFIVKCWDHLNDFVGYFWRRVSVHEIIFRESQLQQKKLIGTTDGHIEESDVGSFDKKDAREYVDFCLSVKSTFNTKSPKRSFFMEQT